MDAQSTLRPLVMSGLFVSLGMILFIIGGILWWHRPITTFRTTQRVWDVVFSPDGQALVVADPSQLRMYHLPDGHVQQTFRGYQPFTVTFCPDGTLIGIDKADNVFTVWDLTAEQVLATFTDSDSITSSAFSPDTHLLAIGHPDGTIRVWRVADGTIVATLDDHTDMVTSLAFSPDGRLLVSGGADNTMKVWEISTRTVLETLEDRIPLVPSIAFSPDGQYVAVGGATIGPELVLWRVADWSVHTMIDTHTNGVLSVAFSPDGHYLASASGAQGNALENQSADPTIRLWRMPDGDPVATIRAHRQRIDHLVFSSDSQWLASGSWDATVKVWRVPDGGN